MFYYNTAITIVQVLLQYECTAEVLLLYNTGE